MSSCKRNEISTTSKSSKLSSLLFLQYQVCDINCCCDSDCADDDRKMFKCVDGSSKTEVNTDGCVSHLSFSSYLIDTGLERLFCIAKSNLPDRRKLNRLEVIIIGNSH